MPPKTPPPRSSLLTLLIVALIAASAYSIFSGEKNPPREVPISELQAAFRAGEIKSLKVEGLKLTAEKTAKTKDGKPATESITATRPEGESLTELGFVSTAEHPATITAVDTAGNDFWLNVLAGVIPFLLIAAFLVFMMRQAQSNNQGTLGFGQSQARVADKTKNKTTFADVAGSHEAKAELVEIVDFLKNPKKYTAMGAEIPKGVMLVGPPGTGKTLLARAVAGEADVPFFSISGSEFVEMFVGVGASRVRDLFKKAKRNAPAIIFIDEIDAVGRQRGAGLGGGHDEREQTLNQILTEMDGFETGANVIVIAATNRPDVLDPALLRPGRFDRRVIMDAPDIKERVEILEVHVRNKPVEKKLDLEKIARQTPGFTGADLHNLLNEAAILAARENRKIITQEDVNQSIEKVALGPERKNRVLNETERTITAYHEAGHALVGHLLPHCHPVHKVSIVSRGRALGVTWYLPEEDLHLHSAAYFRDELASLLGGHVAEELVFQQTTTGSSNDLERATALARRMVTEFGMSATLGPVVFGTRHGSVFLGRDLGEQRNYSEEKARQIDDEVKKLIQQAYATARQILTKHKLGLKKVAQELLRIETVSAEEFAKILGKPKARAEISVHI